MIEDEANVLNLEENVVTLEDLLQIAIAELSDEVDVIEIVDGLVAGYENLDHPDDVWMLAILQ